MSTFHLTVPNTAAAASALVRVNRAIIYSAHRFTARLIAARSAQIEPRVAEIVRRVSDERLSEAGWSEADIAHLRTLGKEV
ncbi:MAG: hypothetical protein AAFR75_03910 [Pseudomonadota bacterium]